jgi:hypothetical protein
MCLRVLRGHLRGAKFLVLENLQFLARKHGGLAWPSPMYFVDKQFCSKSQIYDVLKALVDEQWIEPGHPRPRGRGSAWKVRSHEEWAELTQADDCSLLVDKRLEKTGLESPETGQKVRKPDTPVRSAPRSGQKTQVVPNPLFRPESQVVPVAASAAPSGPSASALPKGGAQVFKRKLMAHPSGSLPTTPPIGATSSARRAAVEEKAKPPQPDEYRLNRDRINAEWTQKQTPERLEREISEREHWFKCEPDGDPTGEFHDHVEVMKARLAELQATPPAKVEPKEKPMDQKLEARIAELWAEALKLPPIEVPESYLYEGEEEREANLPDDYEPTAEEEDAWFGKIDRRRRRWRAGILIEEIKRIEKAIFAAAAKHEDLFELKAQFVVLWKRMDPFVLGEKDPDHPNWMHKLRELEWKLAKQRGP